MKSDAQLKVDVLSEFAWDPCIGRARLDVAVSNGVVTVTGPLETYPDRHVIERAVQRVGGDVKVQHRWVALASRTVRNPHRRSERSAPALTGAETLRATVQSWATRSAK